MAQVTPLPAPHPVAQRPWDARLGRALVRPLRDSWVTPNHLTSIRLATGLGAAVAFTRGTHGFCNLGALLLIVSNFLDHTDGELARLSGKTSRFGHLYDLFSDAAVTILIFVGIGVGVAATGALRPPATPVALGAIAGTAIALIFWVRHHVEEMLGKAGTRQSALGGFETEDVLYLVPLVTIFDQVPAFLVAASVGAPLFALWVLVDYRRVRARLRP
jgi:phosphatidylglycerophosphate synthase